MLRLLFAGFGTVGQGLAELLLEGKETLARECGLEYRVVGISDMLKGSVYDPDGIDLARALEAVKNGGSLNDLPRAWTGGDTLAFIQSVNADVLLEATYTDIKTGEPATAHMKAALDRGMHVVTSNKGPLALHYHELKELARLRGRHFLFEGTVMSGTPCLNLHPGVPGRQRHPGDPGHPQRHHQLHPDPDGGGPLLRGRPPEGPGAGLRRGRARRRRAGLGRPGQGDHPGQRGLRRHEEALRVPLPGHHRDHRRGHRQGQEGAQALQAHRPGLEGRRRGQGLRGPAGRSPSATRWPGSWAPSTPPPSPPRPWAR